MPCCAMLSKSQCNQFRKLVSIQRRPEPSEEARLPNDQSGCVGLTSANVILTPIGLPNQEGIQPNIYRAHAEIQSQRPESRVNCVRVCGVRGCISFFLGFAVNKKGGQSSLMLLCPMNEAMPHQRGKRPLAMHVYLN